MGIPNITAKNEDSVVNNIASRIKTWKIKKEDTPLILYNTRDFFLRSLTIFSEKLINKKATMNAGVQRKRKAMKKIV